MNPNPVLNYIEVRDDTRRILAAMTPGELVAAALRADGLSFRQIGELLGLSAGTAPQRLNRARERIVADHPDLAYLLAGRRHGRDRGGDPLLDIDPDELPEAEPEAWTTAELAERYETTTVTVCDWIRAGRFPNAVKLNSRLGGWQVPADDLVGFVPPRRRGSP
jgi:hypothetical protein